MDLIDLDTCVLNALDLFIENDLPEYDLDIYDRPLVVGSGNAAVTGKILFEDSNVVFADESTYERELQRADVDGAVLISASGKKHAPIIAERLADNNVETTLLTCNEDAPAGRYVTRTYVSPKTAEPYTYNTSTYMGMIFSSTRESPERIKNFLNSMTVPEEIGGYDAYYVIVPSRYEEVRSLFITKFDELFGPKVNGRVFTPEQSKHAKTVVSDPGELFISFGYDNETFGDDRYNIDVPSWMEHGGLMAVGYYVIGKIQTKKPSYFKDNIVEYTKFVSETFDDDISPIVD